MPPVQRDERGQRQLSATRGSATRAAVSACSKSRGANCDREAESEVEAYQAEESKSEVWSAESSDCAEPYACGRCPRKVQRAAASASAKTTCGTYQATTPVPSTSSS